jgi:hypothetical protein
MSAWNEALGEREDIPGSLLAVPATQLRPHMTNHHEVRSQVVEYLGDVFSEFP